MAKVKEIGKNFVQLETWTDADQAVNVFLESPDNKGDNDRLLASFQANYAIVIISDGTKILSVRPVNLELD